GSDYAATSGTLTFNPGITSVTIAVAVNGDTDVEPDEDFFVNLGAPSPAAVTLARGQAQGVIRNDDAVGGTLPLISVNDVKAPEGNSGTKTVGFTVTLSAASTQVVTVQYATADGTATAGSDYTAKSGTLTFNPGVTIQSVRVTV